MLSKEAQLYVNKSAGSRSTGHTLTVFLADGARSFAELLAKEIKKNFKKARPGIVFVEGVADGRFSAYVSFDGKGGAKSVIEVSGKPSTKTRTSYNYNVKFYLKNLGHKIEDVSPDDMTPKIIAAMAYHYAKREGVLGD